MRYRNTKIGTRAVSVLLSLALSLCMVPAVAFAAEDEAAGQQQDAAADTAAATEAEATEQAEPQAAEADQAAQDEQVQAQEAPAADEALEASAATQEEAAPAGATLAPLTDAVDISNATVTLSYTETGYTTTARKPDVVSVVVPATETEEAVTVPETGYTVAYSNNVKIGTATVTVTGDGVSYTGSATATFKIVAAKASLTYSIKQKGWAITKYVAEGKTAGKTSVKVSKNMRIKVANANVSGGVKYCAQFRDHGTSDYVKTGKSMDNEGNTTMQDIQVKLTGNLAKVFDVYYRVNVTAYGWMGWAKNDEKAGTTAMMLNIRAVQIKLVPKGGDAPGKTSIHFATYQSDTETNFDTIVKSIFKKKVKNKSSKSKYLLMTSTKFNRTALFKGKKGKWVLKKWWRCTTGKKGTETPAGTFTIGRKAGSFLTTDYKYTCWYFSVFKKKCGYHSVIYKLGSKTKVKSTNQLGHNKSHGCVRLPIEAAKYIHHNIPKGTKVIIFRNAS